MRRYFIHIKIDIKIGRCFFTVLETRNDLFFAEVPGIERANARPWKVPSPGRGDPEWIPRDSWRA